METYTKLYYLKQKSFLRGFKFYYRQLFSHSMGSPVFVVLTNLAMEILEDEKLEKL